MSVLHFEVSRVHAFGFGMPHKIKLTGLDFRVRGLGLQDFMFFEKNWCLDVCALFKSMGMNGFSAYFRVLVSAFLGFMLASGMGSSHGLAV